MSISPQPLPNAPGAPDPAAKGVSVTTLILSLALAVATTAAVVLAVLHFRQPASHVGGGAVLGDEPLVQKDTASPQGKYTGIVYYPIPYASPPHLKLTAPKRQYDIVKQDERSFTWTARPLMEDFLDEKRQDADRMIGVGIEGLALNFLKPNLQFEDFTWEAKGVRAGSDAGGMTVFPQDGTFNSVFGQEGEVNFPIPYAVAPNVELSGGPSDKVVIVESRPTGFKWKNTAGPNAFNGSGNVTWKARGVRATEIPKPKPQ
jgi:hypothetical protein